MIDTLFLWKFFSSPAIYVHFSLKRFFAFSKVDREDVPPEKERIMCEISRRDLPYY